MKRLIAIVTICLSMVFGSAYAQNAKGYFSVYGGISMPQGDFGDDTGVDAGGAKTSFGIGFDYNSPLKTKGLIWISSVTILLNGLDESDLEAALRSELPGVDFDLDVGRWINIPVLTGLKFQTEISPTLDIYGIGQTGLNFVKAPGAEITAGSVTGEMSYDTATSFGFCFGGGIILKEKNSINIGFRYFLLGEPEIDGTIDVETESEKIQIEQPISIMMLSIGFTFK